MQPGEKCPVCHTPFLEGQEVLPVPRKDGSNGWIHTLCPSRARWEA
jgi:hypothetical protein